MEGAAVFLFLRSVLLIRRRSGPRVSLRWTGTAGAGEGRQAKQALRGRRSPPRRQMGNTFRWHQWLTDNGLADRDSFFRRQLSPDSRPGHLQRTAAQSTAATPRRPGTFSFARYLRYRRQAPYSCSHAGVGFMITLAGAFTYPLHLSSGNTATCPSARHNHLKSPAPPEYDPIAEHTTSSKRPPEKPPTVVGRVA